MAENIRLPLITNPMTELPFIFHSYRNLTSVLGGVDAMGAGLVLAANHFIASSRLEEDEQALTKRLNKTYRTLTNYTDLDAILDHLISLLIVATSKHFEDFLARFRREQKALGRIWRPRDDRESDFKYTLAALPGGFDVNRKRIGPERYDLIEYFRLIRNSAAHPADDQSRNAAEHARILKYADILKREYKFAVPGRYGELTFGDHLLYTILVKYVAVDICRLATPETTSELKIVLADREHFPAKPTRIFEKRAPEDYMVRTLRRFLKGGYNFDLIPGSELEQGLVEWIKSLPSGKERKRMKRPALHTDLLHYI